MTDIPEIPELPDKFESADEAKQYIDRLHKYIHALKEAQGASDKKQLALEEKLDEIEDYLMASTEELEHIHTDLEGVIQRLERIELHGGPSDVGLQDNLRNPDFGGN
jgi:DNA repair exonuclease SbcCD ATPase subunit